MVRQACNSGPYGIPALLGRLFLVLVLTLGFGIVLPVQADERILGFHSDIEVRKDGSMVVEETIRVRTEGKKIRRGIYRDFPTRYQDRFGNRYRVTFDLLGVERDGVTETYRTERVANGVRIYIGRKDHFLPYSEYVYTIKYRTDRQLGFFADHDELYWNVTGNGWEFAIDEASATVELPNAIGGSDLRVHAYTGYSGSRAQDYMSEVEDSGIARFWTTKPLRRREGLTIVVAWPKGYIVEPTLTKKFLNLLRDNRDVTALLAGLSVLLVYYAAVWHRVGRDPRAGIIIPRYVPPKGLSPASARFVYLNRHDDRAFAAAILNLAVKGKLEIDTRGEYVLTRINEDESDIAPGERVLLEKLFDKRSRVALKQDNHFTVRRAMSSHAASLRRDYGKLCFRKNSHWLIPGTALAIAAVTVVMVLSTSGPVPRLFVMALSAAAGATAITAVFYYLLRAPTRAGRKLLDEIEGLRLFMEVANKQELQMRQLPAKSSGLFEFLLPYAVALDVEQQWSAQFTDLLGELKASGVYEHPAWYEGSWDTDHLDLFSRSVGRSLSSAVAVSSTEPAPPPPPPGSSSDFDWDVGGFGGGGVGGFGSGGGGGGGGW